MLLQYSVVWTYKCSLKQRICCGFKGVKCVRWKNPRVKCKFNKYSVNLNCCLVQIPTLAVFALDHFNKLYDAFPVFGLSVQVRMKTTNVCQTFNYLMGHTYSVVKRVNIALFQFKFFGFYKSTSKYLFSSLYNKTFNLWCFLLRIRALCLTHPSTHNTVVNEYTPITIGSQCCCARGAVGGSGALLKGLPSVMLLKVEGFLWQKRTIFKWRSMETME